MAILFDSFLQIDYLLLVSLFDFLSNYLILVCKLFIFSLKLFVFFSKYLKLVRKFFNRYSLALFCLKALEKGLKLRK